MDEVQVETIEDLRSCVQAAPDGALFRGQTRHHENKEGEVSIPTSMQRHGCVPRLQYKWSHYAARVLEALGQQEAAESSLHQQQALLQHYGWRSFFVDASASGPVSAWFACNQFRDETVFALGEDCFELPVTTVHQNAWYESISGTGHLYIIDSQILEEFGSRCINLASIKAPNGWRVRMDVQDAWLIEPTDGIVPPKAVESVVRGSAEVFAQYASEDGYTHTGDVFPSRGEDPILQMLLSTPWELAAKHGHLRAFRRGLPLPEYDFEPTKRHPPQTAFMEPFWIADQRGTEDSPLTTIPFFRAPETCFHMPPTDDSRPLPHVNDILSRDGSLIIEASAMVRHPAFHTDQSYMKGVRASLRDAALVEVNELGVDHPGTQIEGVGIDYGWLYRVLGDGSWQRVDSPDACKCNNPLRHRHHMWTLVHFDGMYGSGMYVQREDKNYEFHDGDA